MPTLNQAARQLSQASNRRRATPKGAAGYDNARENIDPHIVTKVVATQELAGKPVFTSQGGGLPLGEIYIYNNSTGQTIATATWTQVTGLSVGNSVNMTPNATEDHIEVEKSGIYFVTMSASFSGDGGVTWFGGVFTNNGSVQYNNMHTHRKLGASGDVGSVSVSGIGNFNSGDTVELWFRHEAGVNKDIVVKDCTLSMVQIGAPP